MRKWAAATLLVASCTLASAQENAGQPSAGDTSSSWLTRTLSFGSATKADAKPAATDKGKTESPAPIESASVRWKREEAALDRRNAVCVELRRIAFQTQDDALMRKVEELQTRAEEIFYRHTAGLTPPNPALDEQVLDRHLQPGARASAGPVHQVSGASDKPGEEHR